MRAHWETLRAHLERSFRTPNAMNTFDEFRQHPALAPFASPHAVVAHLTTREGDLDAKDCILRALVTQLQRRRGCTLAASLLCLGLWPGLDAVYRRRLRHFKHPAELVAEVTWAFMGLVDRLDLSRVNRVAATLVRSTERDVLRQCKRRWVEEARERSEAAAEAVAPAVDEAIGSVQGWLRPAVGEDAELLLAVFIHEETQREAGQRFGLTHEAARKRIQRGVAKLREFLASPPSHFPALASV